MQLRACMLRQILFYRKPEKGWMKLTEQLKELIKG